MFKLNILYIRYIQNLIYKNMRGIGISMSSERLIGEHMLDSEKNLESWIKKNSRLMFGEEFTWLQQRNVNVDLLGMDSEGKSVIVEVKLWADNPSNRRKQEYACVGQILHYASYLIDSTHPENTRLFIISQSTSAVVESSCALLRTQGFCIEHLSVLDRLEREIDRLQHLLNKGR